MRRRINYSFYLIKLKQKTTQRQKQPTLHAIAQRETKNYEGPSCQDRILTQTHMIKFKITTNPRPQNSKNLHAISEIEIWEKELDQTHTCGGTRRWWWHPWGASCRGGTSCTQPAPPAAPAPPPPAARSIRRRSPCSSQPSAGAG